LKREMSSFDIAMLLGELKETVKDARIENIYHIPPATLIFKLHKPNKPDFNLLFEAGKRFHLTSYQIIKPPKPTAFCMALRKHLRNTLIKEISQHEFERIVTLHITGKRGDFQFVAEFFGEGNIILVDGQNKILQALTYKRMRDRNILRNEEFQYAPPSGKNPLKISIEDFKQIKNYGSLEIVKALTKLLSIGGLYAEEILLRAKIDKNTPCESLTEQQIDAIFNCIQKIFSKILEKSLQPCIVYDEKGEWIDVTPIPLEKYSHLQQKQYATFNEALDEYYMKTTTKEKTTEISEETEKELKRLERILEEQRKALEKAKQEIEKNRRIGDTIYAHFNELQTLLQQITHKKAEGKSWEQIIAELKKEKEGKQVPAVYFHSLEPKNYVLNITIEDLTFPLKLHNSIQTNASNYYDEAKKAERKRKGAEKAIQETLEKIEKLKTQTTWQEKTLVEAPRKIPKKLWFEKFRWFNSSDGFLVIGGKDATTNEILIKKYMEPHDIVFHADIHGAPFVLIKTEGKAISEETLKETAVFAASYSKAWKQMLSAVDVYWVYPQQVSKSPPHGQYLEKGAFIIQGKKNYIKNAPLKLAVGIVEKEKQLKVIGGPVEAVSKQTSLYVEIIPGEQKSSEVARRIRSILAQKAPSSMQKYVLDINLEEIQAFIPSGKGKVLLD
jgi:predicted ribosome quality control (RQC) complex YloA/Tae2 family protein